MRWSGPTSASGDEPPGGPSRSSRARPLASLDRLLSGPPIAWPRPIDAVLRRWAVVAPRIRALTVVVLLLLVPAGTGRAVAGAESRWGGPPVRVLVATRDLRVGEPPDVAPRRLPPAAVPPEAVAPGELPDGAVLAVAVPAGGVLASLHVDPAGPSVGLPDDQRLVPVPVDPSWAITPGGRVDVWVGRGGPGSGAPQLVAAARPVVDVRGDEVGQVTALVAVPEADVPDVTVGLTDGSVLLSHAPGPD